MNNMTTSGIYIILNIKNGNIYIGQAQNIKLRWGIHKGSLKRDDHENRHLQNAWNKYGEKQFEFKILEYCSIEQLDEREQHYLDIYMPRGICYNIAPNAHTSRGIKHSEETRRKIGEAGKGRIASEETKQKLRIIAKNISPEQRAKMTRKGQKNSFEHNAAIIAYNTNKIVSEETKEKLRQINLGKHHSEETKRKMRDSHLGKPKPPRTLEHQAKINNANRGRKHTPETLAKMRESQIKRRGLERQLSNENC